MKYSKQKLKTPIVLSIFNIVAFLFVLNYAYGIRNSNELILFTDSNCTYCEETLYEINFRGFTSHVNLSIKSINGNSLNKRKLDIGAEKCGIRNEAKGVPLLIANDKCFKGKTEILKELERLSIQD